MKRLLLSGFAFFSLLAVSAQQKSVVVVQGDITSNRTFHKDTIYELRGLVYIKGATLTVQPGTVVKGGQAPDGSNATALVVDTDGILNAIGTPSAPIIFTSAKAKGLREYGDWGGIVYFGLAPVNKVNPTYENGVIPGTYGGNQPNHNQGTLKYARIEFAGYPFEANRELNSLTMCGVGNGTTFSYIQCSYNNDDAFEWFGGTANGDHFVAFKTNDDDLDCDFGWTGNVQFAVCLADTGVADVSTKNGWEIDNDANGSIQTPLTAGTFSNVTMIGAYLNKQFVDRSNLHGRGAHIRRNSNVSIHNSIIMGWREGIRMDGANTLNKYTTDSADINNNIFAGNIRNFNHAGGADSATWVSYVTNPAQSNRILAENSDVNLTAPYNYNAPDFRPRAGSPALSGASFNGSRLSGFQQTSYVGAFDADNNWMLGWTEFNPVNAEYDLLQTSVAKVEQVLNLNVFPNPAQDKLNVQFDLLNAEVANIQIIDMTGKVVANVSNNTLFEAGAQSLSVNVDGLNNGFYFITITTGNDVKAIKIAISK